MQHPVDALGALEFAGGLPARRGSVSRKRSGHFCWCCGRMRPNERFSGRNHGRHLCRDCARLPAEEREYRQGERDIERILIPADEVQAKIRELGQQDTEDYG